MIALLTLLASPADAAPQVIEPSPTDAFVETSGPVATTAWWTHFGDPALEELLSDALSKNGDIEAARARAKMATGVQMQAFSPLLPSASFDTTISTSAYQNSFCQQVESFSSLGGIFEALQNDPQSLLTNPDQFGGGGGGTARDLCTNTRAMLNVAWPIDIFGRNSLNYAAQAHEAAAARGDRDAQILALTSMIAEGWYDVVLAEQQVALVSEQLQAQRDLLELIELRYDQGGASGLDVLQQRQQVASTEALLPTARAGRDARKASLAALLGREVSTLPPVPEALPEPQGLPGVGNPEELAEQRPDLQAAQQRARSARDARASAHSGLAPSLTATANAGWTGVFNPDNPDNDVLSVMTQQEQWGAGLTLSIPLFGGGVQHGRIRQARAAESMAVNSYNQALRNAVAEVDGAIRLDVEQRARRDAVQTQSEAARLAYDESVDRYLAGLDTYLSVLASQAANQAAELTLLQARRDAVSARIQLHDAIGQLGR